MNPELYEKEIMVISKSWLDERTVYESWDEVNSRGIPLLTAFLADDDIQEITICSTNIGFVKTFRKEYKK